MTRPKNVQLAYAWLQYTQLDDVDLDNLYAAISDLVTAEEWAEATTEFNAAEPLHAIPTE